MKKNQLPLEPEKVYHIYNRTNGREKMFLSDEHYFEFMQKYALFVAPILDTYAYCLLPNHIHFMVKIKSVDELLPIIKERYPLKNFSEVSDFREVAKLISQQFGNLFSSYTQWFNRKIERNGALFTPNFKRKPVEDPFYFTQLVAYIHLNPVKHGYIEDAMDWTFSSIHAYTSNLKSRVRTDIILDFFGGSKEDLLDFHRIYNEKVVEMQGLGLE